MITDWRNKMDLPLPFYFVQLAAFGADYSLIRQAQMAALKLKNVGYAVVSRTVQFSSVAGVGGKIILSR